MLIGYVSDEHFQAIADVLVQFEADPGKGREPDAVVRSTPTGALYADLAAGSYLVTLARSGYGSKRVRMTVGEAPYQFRLLSDAMAGFAWPKWITSGSRGEFRIHSVEPFRLTLWRYGLKREFVRLLGWHDEHGVRAMMQITPDGDYTQSGVQWNRHGYSNPHVNQLVEAPARSGLYYFHAETQSGKSYSFPWVVAPAEPRERIAVLASTNSWNAYNNWGGRSNYVNASGLPPEPVVNSRLDLRRYTVGPFSEWTPRDDEFLPLSFERPEPGNVIPQNEEAADPCPGRLQSSMAPGEWRLLAWLEREGFGYELYSEHQLHTGQLNLDAYDVLIFGVHPEYWSRDMYVRVKEWVYQRGGRILYLGGNGVNCEVEYPEATTMRLRSHLKSDQGSFSMPDPDHPGEFLESRFHRTVECEANLLGVVSTDSGIMTSAPYEVIQDDHWVFAGTGLKRGDRFGERCSHERCPGGGASGYETDKISRFSPPSTVLLAKGLNPDQGGAEMVCYELPEGGAAFSAGSITWNGSLLVDDGVSAITRNVIERFLRTN